MLPRSRRSPRRSSSSTTADGGVRAIANGRTFAQMQFDPATEGPGRQAGSSFKVFTLAAALSRGYSPERHGVDRAAALAAQPGFGRRTRSTTSAAAATTAAATRSRSPSAIARSDNCAFVRTELSLGPGNFGADGVQDGHPDREGDGHRHVELPAASCRPRSAPTACTRSRWRRPTRCSPNDGVLKRGDVHHEDRRPQRQDDLPGARPTARRCSTRTSPAPRRRCSRACCATAPPPHARQLPASRGGQDGYDRPQPGRLVRRLHAAVHGRGLDGQPERRDPDDQRRRHPRCSAPTYPGARSGGSSWSDATARCRPSISPRPTDTLYNHPRFITELGRKTTYVPASSSSATDDSSRARPPPTTAHADHEVDADADSPTPTTAARRPPTPTTAPAETMPGKGHDVSLDELEALLLVQEQRHHARPAAPPPRGDARTGRARARARPNCAAREAERAEVRRAPSRRARRGDAASTTRPRRSGRAPTR